MLLDSVNFAAQTTDVSEARMPNGTGDFSAGSPTFNASNDVTSRQPEIDPDDFLVFPNPASNQLRIQIDVAELRDELVVQNTFGQIVYRTRILDSTVEIDTHAWSEGMYIFSYKGLSKRILVSP